MPRGLPARFGSLRALFERNSAPAANRYVADAVVDGTMFDNIHNHFVRVRPMTNATHRRRGFTLVELMATMAIVAILAGAMVSALSQAKESARKMRCGN